MFFSNKKEEEVEELITSHILKVKETLHEFAKMMNHYVCCDRCYKDESFNVHRLEHEADVIRRDAEMKLYRGAFLPLYREDYIVLMELIDKIANKAESTADFLTLTRPAIPDFLQDEICELVELTVGAFDPLEKLFEMFQDNIRSVLNAAQKVEDHESTIDKMQWNLCRKAFKSDLPLAEKMLIKELIDDVAAISDKIEDVSDRFEIMVVKRTM